ncbi:MAG: HDOD domain-containing protein [bacterium]
MEKRKYFKGPANVVYNIDGSSYGMDDSLVDAIRTSIRGKVQSGTLVIPRLPQVAGRILQLAQNPNAPVGEVTKAIMGDPGLAARVLSIANSAAYGGSAHVEGLEAALTRLGMKTVCNIVFTESVQTKVFPARAYRELLEQSWRLSLGSAIACEALSRVTGIERPAAFLVGLLHDTGKPTLVNTITEYEKKNQNRPLGEEMVEIVLSQLHEEIGAYVLEQWGMPTPIVDGARLHSRYAGESQSTPSQRLLYAANLVCRHLGIGDVHDGVSFNLEQVFLDLRLSDLAKMERILEAVQHEMAAMLEGFGSVAAARS